MGIKADVKVQSIHGIENEFHQSVYFAAWEYIVETEIKLLIKNKLLQPKLKVKDYMLFLLINVKSIKILLCYLSLTMFQLMRYFIYGKITAPAAIFI